jgi:hypothetical protein
LPETELKLQMLEELSLFDHLVAANIPLPSDATFSLLSPYDFSLAPTYKNRLSFRSSLCQETPIDPPTHWLSELIVKECMVAYRQPEPRTKEAALKVLVDLLIRHSYDARSVSSFPQFPIHVLFLNLDINPWKLEDESL